MSKLAPIAALALLSCSMLFASAEILSEAQEAGLDSIVFEDFCRDARLLVSKDINDNLNMQGVMSACTRNKDNLAKINEMFDKTKAALLAEHPEVAKARLEDARCGTVNNVLKFAAFCGVGNWYMDLFESTSGGRTRFPR